MPSRRLQRAIPLEATEVSGTEPLLTREWIVTNGLGGYASGTVAWVATRRYHGLLVSAQPAPLGRLMMLNHLAETLLLPDGTPVRLGGCERPGRLIIYNVSTLKGFRLEAGLPVWRYEVDGVVLERRLFMTHRQNTVHVLYRLLEAPGRVRLRLRPMLKIRNHDGAVDAPLAHPYTLSMTGDRYAISSDDPDFPPLRLHWTGGRAELTISGGELRNLHYRIEAQRGYPDIGSLWSPGYFQLALHPGRPASLTASTESWTTIRAMDPEEALTAERDRRARLIHTADRRAREGMGAELVLAADQFIFTPVGRAEHAARANAAGDEVRSVIAGYHWFTDWGRDTMISLEGLTLASGRVRTAGFILRTFADYIRDGLIPNLFPEGETRGLYHTVDATLWFFHAVHRYLRATGDTETLRILLPKLLDIVAHHRRGTRFHIGVDPADGLLRQGAEGYQLTWMDAKVGDWVVTPRRGKAVEINALWYNALRLLEGWVRTYRGEDEARPLAEEADRAYQTFNRRFWYEPGGYLYDVVDGEHGDDPSCRPNQIFAISLDHPVLDRSRWEPVVNVVRERLLTPLGLRSLAPGHPDFKPNYEGDLRSRDAAYHQGTVWGWLIGPFIDAWLKLHPDDRAGARRFLEGFGSHLSEAGVGTIGEIFDATAPYTPRGCIAQAWSVAEVLRCWVLTAEEGPGKEGRACGDGGPDR